MGKGQDLYIKAKKIIPGGTQLLSKRPEMFLPNLWPSYYSRAEGCKVWDLDGNEFIDMSYMGIGSNVLGYAYKPVDIVAKQAIDNGSMCTLNAPEEVELAQKFLEMHSWAGGVRFAKAGGEGMALAVRIARAYTEKDIVLVCGYHGWHDWYLSANLKSSDSLNAHHLEGLDPLGVPSNLTDSNFPFLYNDFDGLLALLKTHKNNVAAVVMEPIRNDFPKDDFLEKVREITQKENIVLIFDEITAGFRLCTGGSHLVLGVNPDIAVFAKGASNGYPISSIIGTEKVMQAAQGTFISSTFHTERIGFAASLKTIEEYEQHKVYEKQVYYGRLIQDGWKRISNETDVSIHVGGIEPLSHFQFMYDNSLAYKTYFTQEMLKKGYLASTACYTSFAHSEDVINTYLKKVAEVFGNIAHIIKSNKDILNFLDNEICHSGFARLN